MAPKRPVIVRETRPEDFEGIVALSEAVYHSHPWAPAQLASHHAVFPEGQFVALDPADSRVLGMAASLIIGWSDYEPQGEWRDFTANGTFSNHDAEHGRTLYGAEVMTHPAEQGRGIGTALYQARRELAVRLRLLRIRAGSRLRGYSRFAKEFTPVEYVLRVVKEELFDPTLSFQLKRGFHVIDVVSGYLRHDEESLGFAATIQWLNPAIAKAEHYGTANAAFASFTPTPPP